VLGSVAEGAAGSRRLDLVLDWLDRLPALIVGAGLVVLALAAYWLPGSDRFYNHFVWQAEAFRHGTAVIEWPVSGAYGTGYGNEWMQDVYPLREVTGDPSTTGALLPFPPLPAVVLLPFVALWGFATDIRAVSVLLGAIDVGLAWWALGALPVSRRVRLATTVFFGFGTVFWYAAQLGTTWFFAHVTAVTFVLLAIGVALGNDPEADDELEVGPSLASAPRSLAAGLRRPLATIDRRQVLAGLLFGLACTARLTVAFGAPFFVLVGGGTWVRRSASAALGAAIPIAALLAYNFATTGHVLHPGYEYQYQLEANGYPGLNYHADWGIEDARYLFQNLAIFLLSTPAILPDHVPAALGGGKELCVAADAVRGLFDPSCPIALPRDIGMSIVLTSPAYLLALPALLGRRSRLVAGSFIAVVAIAFVNLMHFSQGWVQFGYRFSNDFVAFALPLVAVGMQRRGGVGLLALLVIAASVAINLWGVIWGNLLGW
jgi:hypothetical protein